MESFIIVRQKRDEDNFKCHQLIKDYVMSFAMQSFITCVFKEFTIQCIVIVWAILFIFFGVPLLFCTISIPCCLLLLLVSVYSTCYMKGIELAKTQPKQSWIAEAFEPLLLFNNSKDTDYRIFFAEECPYDEIYRNKFKKTIVGTVSLQSHNSLYNSGWLSGLSVDTNYPFHKVADPLINIVVKVCCDYGYTSVELATNVWQEQERDLFSKKGFSTRQIYHKQVIGRNLRIMKCQLGLDLSDHTTQIQ